MLKHLLKDFANQVTIIGALLAIVSINCIHINKINLSIGLTCWAIVIDNIDGDVARSIVGRSNELNIFGAHLDCFTDVLTKAVFPATMVLYAPSNFQTKLILTTIIYLSIIFRYSLEFTPKNTIFSKNYGISPDYIIFVIAVLGIKYINYIIIIMYPICMIQYEFPKLEKKYKYIFIVIMAILGCVNIVL